MTEAEEQARKAYPRGRTIKTGEFSGWEGKGDILTVARDAYVRGWQASSATAEKALNEALMGVAEGGLYTDFVDKMADLATRLRTESL